MTCLVVVANWHWALEVLCSLAQAYYWHHISSTDMKVVSLVIGLSHRHTSDDTYGFLSCSHSYSSSFVSVARTLGEFLNWDISMIEKAEFWCQLKKPKTFSFESWFCQGVIKQMICERKNKTPSSVSLSAPGVCVLLIQTSLYNTCEGT